VIFPNFIYSDSDIDSLREAAKDDSPFTIMDVKTSCGCTVPLWEKRPLASGEKTTIKVEVKPDTPGSFRKTITVYGNAENAPLQLAVTGEVTE
jgi:hypothetical protein